MVGSKHWVGDGFWRGTRQGSIAVWFAVMMPGLLVVVALAVQVGGWAAARMSAQRAADVAAVAGVINYETTQNKQTAATFAARMAQLNGVSGTASPSWNSSTNTLTDNNVTAQVINGYYSSGDTALQVTVTQPVLSGLLPTPSYSVTATGVAEVVSTSGSFPGNGNGFPCMLALSSSGTISGSGSTYWTMPNCTVKSNGTGSSSVSVHGGGGPLTTAGIYAVGTVNIDSWITTTGGQYSNQSPVSDPFAGYSALQTALTTAANLTGQTNISCGTTQGVNGTAGQYTGNNNCNGTNTLPNGGSCVTSGGVTCTMYPGNYGSWLVPSGGPYTFNLQPGLYLFSGPILLTQNTTTNGTGGVTIITAGGAYNGTNYSFVGSNTFNFNVSAPTGAQVASRGGNGTTNAGIAGIALASNSSYTATLSGNEAFAVSGVVYFPNATWNASGSSCNSSSQCMGSSSTACLELIAASIETSGYLTFNSQCSTYALSTQQARVTH